MAAKRKQAPKRRAQRRSILKLVWRHATLRIAVTPDYLQTGTTHLELTVVTPKRAPVPLTDTGYLSHFIDSDALAAAGGAACFFADWLEREARSKRWHDARIPLALG